MRAWYVCTELAGAVKAVMSSFGVAYQYTTSMIEHCDLVAMCLLDGMMLSLYYAIIQGYVGTLKSHPDDPDLSEHLSTKYCAVVGK